jgi:tRNA 2-thiouridine synthesizing protein A
MTTSQPQPAECKPQQNGPNPAGTSLANHYGDLPHYHYAIDITGETCPMTFVRTRLALDKMQPGEVLLVRLKGEDPIANVPRAAADQGHDPLDLLIEPNGVAVLVLRKGG